MVPVINMRYEAERMKGLNKGEGDKEGEGGEGDEKLSGRNIILDILVPFTF